MGFPIAILLLAFVGLYLALTLAVRVADHNDDTPWPGA